MKIILTLITALTIVNLSSNAQTDSYKIAHGSEGVSYAFFTYTGTLTFENEAIIGDFYDESGNYCLAKFDEFGNTSWIKNLEGNVSAAGLAVDLDNNIYVTGSFKGELILDDNTTLQYDAYDKAFVAKYDQNGDLQWHNQPEGSLISHGIDVALDEDDHVLLTGRFRAGDITIDDLAPLEYLGAPNETGESNYEDDIFIIQLDSENGNANWINGIQGNYPKTVHSIKADSDGSSYISGRDYYQTSITKFNTAGEMEWQQTSIGPPGYHYTEELVLDNNLNIYATGQFCYHTGFGGTTDYQTLLDSDYKDLFLIKYDASGEGIWSMQASTENSEWSMGKGVSIGIDSSDNIYLAGHLTSSVKFPPLEEQVLEQYSGESFFVKLNQDGEGICQQVLEEYHSVIDISVNESGITNFISQKNNNHSVLIESRNTDCSINWSHEILQEVYTDPISVHELNKTNLVRIYPNPTEDLVTLEFKNPEEETKLIMTNTLGEKVFEKVFRATNYAKLNLPDSNGIFYIKTISESGLSSTYKLIKQ